VGKNILETNDDVVKKGALMRCPWCEKFVFFWYAFCPYCNNDLKGVTRPTLINKKILKKREIEMRKFIEKGEKIANSWVKK
jgi:hypothetical protein